MSIVILTNKLSSDNVRDSRSDYEYYIKITADIEKDIIALGGEYHADAERILIEKYKCSSKNIWGGGYNINTKSFETNAMINLRPGINGSMEIVDTKIRMKYIKLVENKLKNISKYI